MKAFSLLVSACALLAATLSQPVQPEPWTLVLSGATHGHLEPCGCTKPMSGGIGRRARGMESLTQFRKSLVVELGPVVAGASRQDEIKLETLAEFLAETKTDLLALSPADTRAEPALLDAVARLSRAKLTSPGGEGGFEQSFEKGPFRIVQTRSGLSDSLVAAAARHESDKARQDQKALVLVTWQGESTARTLAKSLKAPAVVVYQSGTRPSTSPTLVDGVWIVSVGPKGQFVVSLGWNGAAFDQYTALELTDAVPGDGAGARVYARYQSRVKAERLIEQVPRFETPAYAGSEACRSCHAAEHKTWLASSHSKAIDTLQKVGNDFDPECVGCHVVGLDSTSGYRSVKETPTLAHVGCESCHGPAKAHVENPQVKTNKNASAACASCHNLDHSPGFKFDEKWPLVRH